MCTHLHEFVCSICTQLTQSSEEDIGSLRTIVTGGCKQPDVGYGNQSQVLCKSCEHS